MLFWMAGCTADHRIPPPYGDTVVPPGARLELLFEHPAGVAEGLTEGPAAGPDGRVYFSFLPVGSPRSGEIWRFDPSTGRTEIFQPESHKSNGMVFDAAGGLVAAEGADGGGRGIARWDLRQGTRMMLATSYEGAKLNSPNDLCLDDAGRVYFTDPRYLGEEPRELEHQAVYRLDPGGTVLRITEDVAWPNGIALSPDGRTLYVTETPGARAVLALPLGEDGLVAGPGRVVAPCPGYGCDGMTVDRDGNLYVTVRDPARPGVLVVAPDGAELGFLPTGPGGQRSGRAVGLPTNATFGAGADSNQLYVTVDASLYRIRLLRHGLRAPTEEGTR
jgi:gluconolactonase